MNRILIDAVGIETHGLDYDDEPLTYCYKF